MQGIERGFVVAGRYVVSEVLGPWVSPEAGVIVEAIDAILDHPVTMYLAPHDDDSDVLDAARRAALLTDSRFPRILDVGEDEGRDYVIAEVTGRRWLGVALARGPLSQEAARAVVGEVAKALDHAGQRGLHHGHLTPESVSVDEAGSLFVHGVGIDAALAETLGADAPSSRSAAEANRVDARALIDLLYATSTGHWPSPEGHGDIPAAPLRSELPVPISEITPGVPASIDTFVSAVVRNRERGPSSPSEVAEYLGDWDTSALAELLSVPPSDGPREAPTDSRELAPGSSAAGSSAAGSSAAGSSAAAGTSSSSDATSSGASTPSASPAAQSATASAGRPDTAGNGGAAGAAPRPKVRLRAPESAAPPLAAETDESRATPAQLQAALRRIASRSTERPGTRGLAAGVTGGGSRYDDQLSMRQASTFPLAPDAVDEFAEETPEWTPEETYSAYETTNYAAPSPGSPAADYSRSGQADFDVPDDQDEDEEDGSWFLGGMFETAEQRHQRYAQERAARRSGGSPSLPTRQNTPPRPSGRPGASRQSTSPVSRSGAAAGPGTDGSSRDDATPPAGSSAAGSSSTHRSSSGSSSSDRSSSGSSSGSSSSASSSSGRPSPGSASSATDSRDRSGAGSRTAAAGAGAAAGAAASVGAASASRAASDSGTSDSGASNADHSRAASAGAAAKKSTPADSHADHDSRADTGDNPSAPEAGAGLGRGKGDYGLRSGSGRTKADSTAKDAGRGRKSPSVNAAPGSDAARTGAARTPSPSSAASPSGKSATRATGTEASDTDSSVKGTPTKGASGKGTPTKGVSGTSATSKKGGSGAAKGSATGAAAAAGGAAAAKTVRTSQGSTRLASPSSAPPKPTAAPGDDRRSSRRRGLWIGLLIVAVIAIGALLFALLRPSAGDDEVVASDETTQAQEPTEAPTTEAPAPVAPEIDSVTSLDPDGDGDEKEDAVDNVLPGERGAWTSETYNSPEFGNLKEGLGLGFTLSEEATVSSVTVTSGSSGGTFEIRVSDGDDPKDAETVGEGSFRDGEETVELDEPTEATNVFVWITSLPSGGDGYRASIGEVTID